MHTGNAAGNRQDHNEPFHVANGVVTSEGNLYWELLDEFDAMLGKLLECRKQRLVVDLRAATFISSTYVGCLCNFVLRAKRKRKTVVVKVSEDIGWLFEILGANTIVDLQVA